MSDSNARRLPITLIGTVFEYIGVMVEAITAHAFNRILVERGTRSAWETMDFLQLPYAAAESALVASRELYPSFA